VATGTSPQGKIIPWEDQNSSPAPASEGTPSRSAGLDQPRPGPSLGILPSGPGASPACSLGESFPRDARWTVLHRPDPAPEYFRAAQRRPSPLGPVNRSQRPVCSARRRHGAPFRDKSPFTETPAVRTHAPGPASEMSERPGEQSRPDAPERVYHGARAGTFHAVPTLPRSKSERLRTAQPNGFGNTEVPSARPIL